MRLLFLLCLTIYTHFSLILGQEYAAGKNPEFICPPNEQVGLCSCFYDAQKRVSISCEGDQITQSSLHVLFKVLRTAISLRPDDEGPSSIPYLYTLNIINTPLTTINLQPFFWTKFTRLCFYDNLNLTNIVGSKYSVRFYTVQNETESSLEIEAVDPNQGQDQIVDESPIQVDKLVIEGSPRLDNKGMGDSLRYFSNEMTELSLRYCRVQGSLYKIKHDQGYSSGNDSADQSTSENTKENHYEYEFIPGISLFTNLRVLELDGNNIENIKGGQFKRNSRLEILSLTYNKLTGLGDGAFLLNPPPKSISEFRSDEILDDANVVNFIVIDLRGNYLYTGDFLRNLTGLINLSREKSIELNLEYNKIEILRENLFKPFLQANYKNILRLKGNPLLCGHEQMLWLRQEESTQEFQNSIFGAECRDSSNQTIFDS